MKDKFQSTLQHHTKIKNDITLPTNGEIVKTVNTDDRKYSYKYTVSPTNQNKDIYRKVRH